ncbi:MAG: hypothetical protein R2827_00125 [Bdellovibrionales bacterium]
MKINNSDFSYSQSGTGVDIDYFPGAETGATETSSPDTWINFNFKSVYGFSYSSRSTNFLNADPLAGVPPSEFKFDMYSVKYAFVFNYNHIDLEIPLIAAALKETDGSNVGDEKYGLGLGLHFLYKVLGNHYLGLELDYFNFSHGKNESTGNSGSLSSPTTSLNYVLSYKYRFNSSQP